jgi:hypothetical protein
MGRFERFGSDQLLEDACRFHKSRLSVIDESEDGERSRISGRELQRLEARGLAGGGIAAIECVKRLLQKLLKRLLCRKNRFRCHAIIFSQKFGNIKKGRER